MLREFTPDMSEISGFGGGYEEACRKMVLAGCTWFDENPEAAPEFSSFENVYGILMSENEHAKALSQAMVDAVKEDGGATGAMHQATMGHVIFIHKNGWEKYQAEMRKPEPTEPAEVAA